MNSVTAAAAARGSPASGDGADEPGTDDHTVGDGADLGRLIGGRDPETDRDRHGRVGLGRRDQVGERLGISSRSPVVRVSETR